MEDNSGNSVYKEKMRNGTAGYWQLKRKYPNPITSISQKIENKRHCSLCYGPINAEKEFRFYKTMENT